MIYSKIQCAYYMYWPCHSGASNMSIIDSTSVATPVLSILVILNISSHLRIPAAQSCFMEKRQLIYGIWHNILNWLLGIFGRWLSSSYWYVCDWRLSFLISTRNLQTMVLPCGPCTISHMTTCKWMTFHNSINKYKFKALYSCCLRWVKLMNKDQTNSKIGFNHQYPVLLQDVSESRKVQQVSELPRSTCTSFWMKYQC